MYLQFSSLLEWDYWLFSLINGRWHTGFLDQIFPFWRDEFFWMPLYLFVILFLGQNFKPRQALYIVLFAVITIVLSDQLSSSVIKPLFERLRPCRNPLLADTVRLLVPCGSGKSFVSAHATNHFAFAVYLSVLFGALFPRLPLFALFWAASVAYGQVYVGVHYPSDVVGGALLGIAIGFFTAKTAQFMLMQKNCPLVADVEVKSPTE